MSFKHINVLAQLDDESLGRVEKLGQQIVAKTQVARKDGLQVTHKDGLHRALSIDIP